MPYQCSNPAAYNGKVVGNGQCVRFVQSCSTVPQTMAWKQGVAVRGANIPAGTAIATFINGKYPSMAAGNHAAIYISQDATGIWVWDQWVGQPVHKRHIRFKNSDTIDRSNNGAAFSVIE